MLFVKVKNISGTRLSVSVQGIQHALVFEKNEHKMLDEEQAQAMKEMLGPQRKNLFRFVNVLCEEYVEAEEKIEEVKEEIKEEVKEVSVEEKTELDDKPKKKFKSKK